MMWLAIGGGLLLFAFLFIVVPKMALGAVRRSLEPKVVELFPDKESRLIEEYRANSFGLESLGAMQARGNGALVLTPREVVFLQLLPSREVRIPLETITETSLVHSHLGKATPYKLVKISFEKGGAADAIAIFLPDSAGVRDRIEAARSRALGPAVDPVPAHPTP